MKIKGHGWTFVRYIRKVSLRSDRWQIMSMKPQDSVMKVPFFGVFFTTDTLGFW